VCTGVPITAWPALCLAKDQRWEGYSAQCERVLAISEKIPGLVWVAGDFHFGAVARVDPPGGAHFAQTEVLVGPVAHVKPALAVVQLTGDPAQFVPVDQRRAQLRSLHMRPQREPPEPRHRARRPRRPRARDPDLGMSRRARAAHWATSARTTPGSRRAHRASSSRGDGDDSPEPISTPAKSDRDKIGPHSRRVRACRETCELCSLLAMLYPGRGRSVSTTWPTCTQRARRT